MTNERPNRRLRLDAMPPLTAGFLWTTDEQLTSGFGAHCQSARKADRPQRSGRREAATKGTRPAS